MSMPISSVGVATRTFGAEGSSDPRLNPSSKALRSSVSSMLECSRATIRVICALV